VKNTIRMQDLDRRLDRAAKDPDKFVASARRIARDLDRRGAALELDPPSAWRKPTEESDRPTARPTLAQQFRSEVDEILPMDREEEARLARRVEFARVRLELALQRADLDEEDLQANLDPGSFDASGCVPTECRLPAEVLDRWRELHALRSEMVERNLYLVLINVERYSHTTAAPMDLIQEGSAALFRAVDGFDWRRGLLFRTYAVHWLNQAFRSYLYNFSHTVRVPVYLQKALKHINDAKSQLGDDNASVEEIADKTNLGENVVATAMWASRSSYSLDVEFEDNGEGGRLRDLLESDDDGDPYDASIEEVSLEDSISQALERLSDRERFVVCMRFGIGVEREHTLAEVAAELGVSLERVRQIQVRALGKLKTPTLRKAVAPYL
jgi:RNA polymerase sigma factor (sigma-70 family)